MDDRTSAFPGRPLAQSLRLTKLFVADRARRTATELRFLRKCWRTAIGEDEQYRFAIAL